MNDYRMEERTLVAYDECKTPIRDLSLSSLMHASYEKAQEASKMANTINRHLFGEDAVNGADNSAPSCFMDELTMPNRTLIALCTELECLMKRLGV